MPPVGKVPPSGEDFVYTMLDGEDAAVVGYRFMRLIGLGIDLLTASALAEIADSPHRVEELVARGCALEVAASIVL